MERNKIALQIFSEHNWDDVVNAVIANGTIPIGLVLHKATVSNGILVVTVHDVEYSFEYKDSITYHYGYNVGKGALYLLGGLAIYLLGKSVGLSISKE